jgi:hypothetical protein
MDGSEWSNNVGSFAVKVTREPRPSLGLRMYAGLTIAGSVGRTYQIEFLETLSSKNWQPLEKIVLTTNPQVYIDPQSVDFPTRFYRARLLP